MGLVESYKGDLHYNVRRRIWTRHADQVRRSGVPAHKKQAATANGEQVANNSETPETDTPRENPPAFSNEAINALPIPKTTLTAEAEETLKKSANTDVAEVKQKPATETTQQQPLRRSQRQRKIPNRL